MGSDQSSAALPAPLGWMFQRGGDRQRAVPGFPEGGGGWSESPAWTLFVAPACYQACPCLAARWGRAEVGLASGWAGAGTGAHRGACGKEGKARPLTLLHAVYLQYHLLLPGHLTGPVSGGFLSALSLRQFMAYMQLSTLGSDLEPQAYLLLTQLGDQEHRRQSRAQGEEARGART